MGKTIFWGFILWLFGYVLGIALFAFVPKDAIGWYIMPFGIIVTLLVLFKKIKMVSLGQYFIVGGIWMIMAIVLDFVFLVKLFNSPDYYKLDVYIYYVSTLLLPVIFGYLNMRGKTPGNIK